MTQQYCTYDYLNTRVDHQNALEIANHYKSLGWELQLQETNLLGTTTLTFKRDSRIRNKEALNFLQFKIEDKINNIAYLEESKTRNAGITALILGIIGSLTFGGGMSLCIYNDPAFSFNFIGGLILGVIGIIICMLNVIIYQTMVRRKTTKVNTLISKKKEEINDLCIHAFNTNIKNHDIVEQN